MSRQQLRLNYLLNVDFDGPIAVLVQSFEGTWIRQGIDVEFIWNSVQRATYTV